MSSALYVTPKLPFPPQDGGRIASWNLARCLRHNGYEIDLVSFVRDPEIVARSEAELSTVFRSIHTVTKDVSRQVPMALARALVAGDSYFVRKYRDRALEVKLRHLLEQNRYELSLMESAYTGVYAPVIASYPSAGCAVLRPQNVEYEIFDRLAHYERHPLLRMLLRRESKHFGRFELDLFRQVEEVRAISERDAARIFEATGRRVGVLNAFVDCDRYRPAPAEALEEHTVVCIGDLAWLPNRNGILWFHRHVWPQVAERFPRARLYVVGKNPPDEIRSLADDRVEVTGYVDDDIAYFRRAHLFIVPLLEGSGVRIKILIALAMGKEVLSTSVGAEGIDYAGLRIEDGVGGWIEQIGQAFGRRPQVDSGAVDYARRNHHWQRPLELGSAAAE